MNAVSAITIETVLAFLRFLFFDKCLAPATIATYKAALGKPLRIAFGIDVSGPPFIDFIRGLHNLKPSSPVKRIRWSLDRVLDLCLSKTFVHNPSILNSLYVSAFLLSLATGTRVSELHSILRGEEFMEFSNLGVRLFPNPNFLAKNERPDCRRPPIFISRLKTEGGEPHLLCPVRSLERYISVTKESSSVKLFVHPVTLKELSISKLRFYLCKFIRMANPTVFPKTHDLRKLATSYAFFKSMCIEEICELVGWSSIRVFKRHYLKEIEAISSSLICLGREINPSKES